MRVSSARTGGHHAEKLKPSTSTSVQFSKRGGSDPVVLVATRGEKCKLTSTILNVKANTPTNVFFYYYYYLCVDCCRFLCSDMQVALSEICAQLLC
jgi:hypothetical protein